MFDKFDQDGVYENQSSLSVNEQEQEESRANALGMQDFLVQNANKQIKEKPEESVDESLQMEKETGGDDDGDASDGAGAGGAAQGGEDPAGDDDLPSELSFLLNELKVNKLEEEESTETGSKILTGDFFADFKQIDAKANGIANIEWLKG